MNHVEYTVSGTPHEVSSSQFVPNGAAVAIRINAFLAGVLVGIIITGAAIVMSPTAENSAPGSVPGHAPTQNIYDPESDESVDVPTGPLNDEARPIPDDPREPGPDDPLTPSPLEPLPPESDD